MICSACWSVISITLQLATFDFTRLGRLNVAENPILFHCSSYFPITAKFLQGNESNRSHPADLNGEIKVKSVSTESFFLPIHTKCMYPKKHNVHKTDLIENLRKQMIALYRAFNLVDRAVDYKFRNPKFKTTRWLHGRLSRLSSLSRPKPVSGLLGI